MSLKKERFIKGIILAPDTLSLDGIEGEIKVDSSTGKIQVTLKDGVNPSASREIVTSSQTQSLTNKTLTSPVIDTGVSGTAIETDLAVSASATKLASASAIKTYVDNVASTQNEASEISYSNATSGLTATNVQNAIDEVDGNVDNLVTLSGVALDSTDLGIFTGVTIPDNSDIKEALQAIETSHESHTGASSGVHGVAGSVVGTSDSQALTNKTIDADLNTISNIENADIKVGANIARSKLASGTANRVVVNDATGVQTDAAAITAARVLISDANGIPTHSTVTSTTLSYVDATSSIQNQLDAKVDESGGTLTNGSVITPARLDVKQDTKANLTTYALTAANGQLCFATDTKEMFQIVDGLLESVGGGAGIGGVDILFSQTFEEAALTDFTQTGLSLSTSSPLHGEISALLTHDSSINQLFKQIIPVDIKFRGQTMVLRLDSKSSASQGNVVINIYDETNSTNLVASEQLQLSNDVNGKRTSVSFTIPETCASLSYTITALPEAGSPTTRIDDIICELAETALLETAVEMPVISTQSSTASGALSAGAQFTGVFTTIGSGIYSVNSGIVTVLKTAVFNISFSATNSTTTTVIPAIEINNVAVSGDNSPAVGSNNASSSYTGILTEGTTISFQNNGPGNASSTSISLSAVYHSTTTKTIPLTQSGLVQEADSVLYAAGNAAQPITVNVTDIPFIAVSNEGSAISFNGSSVTTLLDGVYSFDIGVLFTASLARRLSIYVNNIVRYETASATDTSLTSNITLNLKSGDVVKFRVSGNGGTLNNATSFHYLNVFRQGSLKQIAVSSDQKLRIPTSELRFEGASARGTGSEAAIVQFTSLAKIRGDAFTVVSTASEGTYITMKKAGILNVSASLCSNISTSYISKNQQIRSSVPIASETMAAQSIDSNGNLCSLSSSFDVQVGDVIRISSSQTPIANNSNSLNLSFQEQDISVSVTNTLPQFSESDSIFIGKGNGGTSVTASVTDIPFTATGTDTTSSWNGSQYVVKETGLYNISVSMRYTVAQANLGIDLYVNGVSTSKLNADSGSNTISCGSGTFSFIQGDIISIRASQSGTLQNVTSDHYLIISKVGKPNVTGVDVTPFVNVPQPESQHLVVVPSVNVSSSNILGNAITSIGSGLFSYNSSTGVYTVLKRGNFNLHMSGRTTTSASTSLQIFVDEIGVSQSDTTVGSGYEGNASYSAILNVGSTFRFFCSGSPSNASETRTSVLATALSDQILTAPETFSTDTASLKYVAGATSVDATLASLANASVGSYTTFTYAGGSNSRSFTTTRPTQTDADMNANGIQMFTRVYSLGSSAAQPAAIAIQIGKGMKGVSTNLYGSANRINSGSLEFSVFATNATENGIRYRNYNESTGILYIDLGIKSSSSVTAHNLVFDDLSGQTSGYFVINASKNPVITGFGLNRIAARAVNSAGTSIQTTTNTVVWDATKVFDTHGALNTAIGVFTAPETGYYKASAALACGNDSYTVNQSFTIYLYKNGVEHSRGTWRAMAATTIQANVSLSDTVFLAKGDTLDIRAANESGPTALITTGSQNFFSIVKVSI